MTISSTAFPRFGIQEPNGKTGSMGPEGRRQLELATRLSNNLGTSGTAQALGLSEDDVRKMGMSGVVANYGPEVERLLDRQG